MNVWKLEWLRLVRTRRLLALLAVFIIFGFVGPLTAKYLPAIISGAGNSSGLQITVTRAPNPADGFQQYLSNILQLGLLVIVIIAAGSLAVDAKTSLSIFYRTRIAKVTDLLLPRFIVTTLATLGAFFLGTLAAWYETNILLGPVSIRAMVVGSFYLSLYWVFCIATVAFAASIIRGLVGVIGLALGILLLFPALGSIKQWAPWIPPALTSSMTALLENQHTANYYYKSMGTTAGLIIVFLVVALMRAKTRELEA